MDEQRELRGADEDGQDAASPRSLSAATRRLIEQLERLVADASRPAMKAPLLQRLAKTWEQRAGEPLRALRALVQAAALAPEDRRLRAEIERVSASMGDREVQDEAWARLLEGMPESPARVQMIVVRAQMLQDAGDHERSLACYQRALASLQGGSPPLSTLRPLIGAALDSARHDSLPVLLDALRSQAEALLDEARWAEGAAVLTELLGYAERAPDVAPDWLPTCRLRLAGTLREHLGDLAGAARVLEAAAAEQPEETQPLRALLEVQVARDDTEGALATIERLVPLVTSDSERASYHYMAAQLLSDDGERARDVARHLLATVKHDLDRRDALLGVESLLARIGDWEGLAEALADVAEGAKEQGAREVEFHLRRRLAEHHVSRTGDRESAVVALRRAIEIDGAHRSAHLLLAELLEGLGREEEAIAVLRAVLALDPGQDEPWRALARLFGRRGNGEGLRSALGVVVLSEGASEEERALLAEHPRPWLSAARRTVPRSALLRLLRGGEEASPTGELMRLLHDNLGEALDSPTLRSFGLGRGDEIEADGSLLFMRTLQSIARLLDVEPPRVFFDEQGGGFRILPTRPPVIAVSGGILRGRREADLAFLGGKALALLHPELALAGLLPLAGLKGLLHCVRAFLDPPSFRVPVDGAERRRVEAVVKELRKRVDESDRKRLARVARGVGDEDVVRWAAQATRCANRLGLLCAGDIVRAARMSNRPIVPHPSYLDDREAIVDLALFAVTPEYLELRRWLWESV